MVGFVRKNAIWLLLLGIAVNLFLNVENGARVSASVASQLQNRTHNVLVWCGAINSDRDYNRAFVQHVTRGRVVYALGDLNCAALASATEKSANGVGTVTTR